MGKCNLNARAALPYKVADRRFRRQPSGLSDARQPVRAADQETCGGTSRGTRQSSFCRHGEPHQSSQPTDHDVYASIPAVYRIFFSSRRVLYTINHHSSTMSTHDFKKLTFLISTRNQEVYSIRIYTHSTPF